MELIGPFVSSLNPVIAVLNAGLIVVNFIVCRRGFRVANKLRVDHTFRELAVMQMETQRRADRQCYRSLYLFALVVILLSLGSVMNFVASLN